MTVMAAMTSITLAISPPGWAQEAITLVQAKIVDCGEVVEDVLPKKDARLLSIRSQDDCCTIVVLITKEGERPRKVIFQVPRSASGNAK